MGYVPWGLEMNDMFDRFDGRNQCSSLSNRISNVRN